MARSWNELSGVARERWENAIERARAYVIKQRERTFTVKYLLHKGTPQERVVEYTRTAGRVPKVSNEVAYERAQKLKSEGFLHFEVKHLIFFDINGPRISAMREERRQAYKEAKVTFNSWNEWQKHVASLYKPKDQRRKQHVFSDGKLNPFSLVDTIGKRKGRPKSPEPVRTSIPKADRDFAKSAKLTKEKARYSKPRKVSPETTAYLKRMVIERDSFFEQIKKQRGER